jgi:hypothetical protein
LARYLLVADEAAGSRVLGPAVRALLGGDARARLTLLIPQAAGEDAGISTRGAVALLQGQGLQMVGARVGDADPVVAVGDEFLAGRRYDAVIVAASPTERALWSKLDVIGRLRRASPNLRLLELVVGGDLRSVSVPLERPGA